MSRYSVVLPPSDLAAALTATLEPLYAKIRCNSLQARTLAALRDALLPKLISGELRVRDAERVAARRL